MKKNIEILIKRLITERDAAEAKWHAHQKEVPCKGCPGGHKTFWGTVIESKQWKAWEKHTKDFDVFECAVCGHISQNHFQAFLKFAVSLDSTA